MNLQKEVILVTGSSGFIGSAAIRRLAPAYRLVGFDREGDPYPPLQAECVCVDLTSDESVRAGLERLRYAYGAHIASVIHLAAYYEFSAEPNPLYEAVTVRGTERLLRGLQDFSVEQFIFSSTMLVHAPTQPGQHIDEDWPLEAKWPYPESKVKTEALIRAEHGDIPVVLLRIAGVYDDTGHSIPLVQQIRRIYERQLTSHFFPGHASHGQAFVHLEDLVEVFVRLVERRRMLPPELPLLIGETETLSYDELQHTIGRHVHGEEWETYQIPEQVAEVGAWIQEKLPAREEPFIKPGLVELADDHYALDITRARTLLEWVPRHSLRKSLPEMIAALKADPVGWYQEHDLELPASLERETERPAETEEGSREGDEPDDSGEAPDLEIVMMEGDGPMAERGVTRPQMQMGDDEMTAEDRQQMLRRHHTRTLWIYLLLALLGVWLISSPFTLGYGDPETVTARVLEVTESRALPAVALRAAAMTWSDLISGALLVVLGLLSLKPRRLWAPWAASLVGVWLLFAPVIFWAPSAAAYANDTFVGALVIALTILIPGMPGMILIMQSGPEVPPGWSYNPSSWLQRAPIIALGWVGFFLSRYLAAYQLGYISAAWDPFFGAGTMQILDSDISRAWPISDAALGTIAYTLEALMGYMGGTQRWRTMPWMVTFFGILVVPLGIVSITLVILQPVAVGTWCTFCLITAIAMLIMIPLTLDEVLAMGQFLVNRVRAGESFWRVFFKGGTVEGGSPDERSPRFTAPPHKSFPAMVWGVNVPWNLLLSAALGVWLMAAPDLLGSQGAMANNNHLAGALVVTIAVIAMAELARLLRFLNVPLGLWFIAAPWLLQGATAASTWSNVLVGLLLIPLSLPRGPVREQYSGWQRYIR